MSSDHTVSPDFSLVLGGPLFQLLRRAHLSDDALLLQRRRIVGQVCPAQQLEERATQDQREIRRCHAITAHGRSPDCK